MKKTALICGVSGQDGAYLSKLLLAKGYRVVGASRDATMQSFLKLYELGIADKVEFASMTLNDFRSVAQLLDRVRPEEIYNLSGQSSVGLSYQQPVETLESITIGTVNLLEAIRFLSLETKLYSAGSGECFGDTNGQPAGEDTPFRPRSPYATAKSAAYWIVANYREAYGLYACTGILFNHESPLRPARFVTSKIIAGAVAISLGRQSVLQLGDLSVSRDWGWAPEYVDAMWRMLQLNEPQDLVIATGESHTLKQFCKMAFDALGLEMDRHVKQDDTLLRPTDIAYGCGNPARAKRVIEWTPCRKLPQIIEAMICAEQLRQDASLRKLPS